MIWAKLMAINWRLSARYEKAKRGELVVAAPVGFVSPATGWRRIRIAACRRQSAWFSTKWLTLAAHGRRFCGFTSDGLDLPARRGNGEVIGGGHATRRSTGW
jgi:hypothetical protein